MTPGGIDVAINTTRPVELMDLAVRTLFVRWKHALACDSNGVECWHAQTFFNIPFADHKEMFVFQSKKHFDQSGDDVDKIDYIQLLREDDSLTVVMAKDSREGMELVDLLTSVSLEQSHGTTPQE